MSLTEIKLRFMMIVLDYIACNDTHKRHYAFGSETLELMQAINDRLEGEE